MSSSTNNIQVVDILTEFIEVAVHNIIYVRKLYPESIFVPKKKYGVIVYQAIHPGVQDYIRDCLKAVQFHSKKKQLKKVFVCFECDNTVLEKYVFDVLELTEHCERDLFLVELEQSLRAFILQLHSSQNYMNELSSDATFSIQLQTNFSSNVEFNEDPKYEATRRKLSGVRIRFKEEVLNMKCGWKGCTETFLDSGLMYKHLVDHAKNSEDDFDCKWSNCPKSTGIPSPQILIRHLAYHGYLARLINMGENVLERNNLPDCKLEPNYSIEIEDNGYTCHWEGCNFVFNTVYEFFSHVDCHSNAAPSGKRLQNEGVILCLWSGCGASFTTRYKLGDHLKVHKKERMIACPKCITLFSTKTTFCDHRKRQLKSHLRSYQCSQCLKLFSSERILSDHMRAHINQYKCTMCDMTCSTPSTLAKHYRYRHMKERPFSCKICKKKFVTNANLSTHLLTHQDKPFKCDQCEFGCKSKVGLGNHVEKVHGIEKPMYECQVCKVLFKRGDYLTRHLMKMHNFHWPSGHSRFRYRKDLDGVCRLQTVRYESLEVTEEMIRSESMKPTKNPNAVTYNVSYDQNELHGFKLTVSEDNEKYVKEIEVMNDDIERQERENQGIIITIEDLDDEGNVINCQQISSCEIFLDTLVEKSENTPEVITENGVSIVSAE